MIKSSKQKAAGELSDGVERRPLGTPSTSEASPSPTLATSENSPNQKSQIGFQATPALGEMDEETANVHIIMAFAAKLGDLVEWRRIKLGDGQEVIALCFSLSKWTPNGSELVVKK